MTVYQAVTQHDVANLRLTETQNLPELLLGGTKRYHLFLSHVWSSGQDQAATIKRQLQLLLPGVKVFLDIDDLDCVDDLEKHVAESQAVLVFLSKGYFFSASCKRELTAALEAKVPIILVHETNVTRGGALLGELKADCSADHRDALFGRTVIPWYRQKDFQLVSLKAISSALLHACPQYVRREALPEVYMPGDIESLRLTFRRPVTLFVSANNPGAAAIAMDLYTRWASLDRLRLHHQLPESLQPLASRKEASRKRIDSSSAIYDHLHDAARHTARRLTGSEREVSHMLLYLNDRTFLGEAGASLAEEVRMAWHSNLPVLLLHETDPARGGSEFATFLRTTPDDIIAEGLYRYAQQHCLCL